MTTPTPPADAPTPTPRTDAVNECAKRLILNRPFGSSTADLLQELADLYSKHAESLERFLGSALANNDPLREKVIEFQRELAAKDAMIAALEKDKARLLRVANGCHDYGGGYRDADKAEIFHHGIQTVINALTAAAKNDPGDTQVNALECIGRAAIDAAREGQKS